MCVNVAVLIDCEIELVAGGEKNATDVSGLSLGEAAVLSVSIVLLFSYCIPLAFCFGMMFGDMWYRRSFAIDLIDDERVFLI